MKRIAVLGLAMALMAPSAPAVTAQGNLSFFITSVGPGKGADLGGLAGADAQIHPLQHRSTHAASAEPVAQAHHFHNVWAIQNVNRV